MTTANRSQSTGRAASMVVAVIGWAALAQLTGSYLNTQFRSRWARTN